MKSQVRQTR